MLHLGVNCERIYKLYVLLLKMENKHHKDKKIIAFIPIQFTYYN